MILFCCGVCGEEAPFLVRIYSYMTADDGRVEYYKTAWCSPCVVRKDEEWRKEKKDGS